MPFANYKVPQGSLSAEQKAEIIHRTTALFTDYFGEGVRPYTMVLVEEVVDGGFGRADEVYDKAAMRRQQEQHQQQQKQPPQSQQQQQGAST